ncbi:hypothetical protein HP546_19550 [Pseudomonas sp. CM25]|nr:hypothetical protein [Pseudomonas sp. CM25]
MSKILLGRFRVINRDTGLPVSGLAVQILSDAGTVRDITDGEGYTKWVGSEMAGTLKIIRDEGDYELISYRRDIAGRDDNSGWSK